MFKKQNKKSNNKENCLTAKLLLKNNKRMLFKQKGDGNRRRTGTYIIDNGMGKKKNRVNQIDCPSPNSLLKSCVKAETKVITQSVVMFNVCKRNS